jgi:hypothetical protein
MLRLNCGSAGRDALNPDEVAHTHNVAFWFEVQGCHPRPVSAVRSTVSPLPLCSTQRSLAEELGAQSQTT